LATEALPGFPEYNCSGLFGVVCSTASDSGSPNPKWRHKLRVTWSTPWDVDVSLAWRYIGAVSLDANTSDPLVGGGPVKTVCPNGQTVQGAGDCIDARISSYSYFDLAADWTVRQGIDLRAGVNNVFDIEPPVLGSSAGPLGPFNGNTYASTYDGLGREVFVSATIKY
jgi:outer membrane receptor protein involved in Fe transport